MNLRPLAPAGAAVAGAAAAAVWWRRHPSACPYSQRFWVQAPHPFITRARLLEILDPRPGERMLEIGPGTGYYSLPVAERLGDGTLEILDVQQQMLDHVLRLASARGIANISAHRADARSLPFDDASFDAAYVCVALGEIPERLAALRELRRVVRPGGRVVVGEIMLDPHVVTFGDLRERAAQVGLELERRSGPPLGYFARFAPA